MLNINILYQPPEVIDALKSFLLKPCGFFILTGINGTGKTFASKALLEDFEKRYNHGNRDNSFARLLTQAELNMLWKSHLEQYHSDQYLAKVFIEPKLLIIDDIGTRTPTEAFLDFLYFVVDQRFTYKNSKATFFTTNKSAEELKAMLGSAILSRINSGVVFTLKGEDRRVKESVA